MAKAAGIEPSESELDHFMDRLAVQAGINPRSFREQVERTGRRLAVRSDLKKSKAFDWVVEHAEVTDDEGNAVDQALLKRESQEADDVTDALSDAPAEVDEGAPSVHVHAGHAGPAHTTKRKGRRRGGNR